MKGKFLLGITTYKRDCYLLDILNSFVKNTDFRKKRWEVIIVDDYPKSNVFHKIKKYYKFVKIKYVKNKNNMGVHFSTNVILKYYKNKGFSCGFKADDDILFARKGWSDLYFEIIKNTKYKHLTYFNKNWKSAFFDKSLSVNGFKLQSHSDVMGSLGCFWTFDDSVLNSVGFFDVKNFGKRGYGHIDYSARCCRAGFNNFNSLFQPYLSENYIKMQPRSSYVESMPYFEVKKMNGKDIVEKKIKLINFKKRIFVK